MKNPEKKAVLDMLLLNVRYLVDGKTLSLREKVNETINSLDYSLECAVPAGRKQPVAEIYYSNNPDSGKSGSTTIVVNYQKPNIIIFGEDEKYVHNLGKELRNMLFNEKEIIPNPNLKEAKITYYHARKPLSKNWMFSLE
jgi:hypothetical protein